MSNGIFKIVPGRNHRGEHIFAVIVKRTYRINGDGTVTRSAMDQPLRMVDQYYDDGEPDWATIQYESELAPYKLSTDVVVVGKAHAPEGEAVFQMDVSVTVGDKKKSLLVTGNRLCVYRDDDTPLFTEPIPFLEMEIRYERAYGGRDLRSIPDIPFFYPRNYMGTGVALTNVKEVIDDLMLPNIEDPDDLLTPERVVIGAPERWHEQPLPQGFGWRSRTWYPRCALLGSYPSFTDVGTVTREERMGLLPADHIALAKQSRLKPLVAQFNNGASYGMMYPDLRGDELIVLEGLTPVGLLEFSLPGETPTILLDISLGMQQLPAQLHTVTIRPEDGELDLIWRGASVYEGYAWLPKMKRLHAEVH